MEKTPFKNPFRTCLLNKMNPIAMNNNIIPAKETHIFDRARELSRSIDMNISPLKNLISNSVNYIIYSTSAKLYKAEKR